MLLLQVDNKGERNKIKSYFIPSIRKEDAPAVSLDIMINLNNDPLTEIQSVTYPGMHLDKLLTWKDHIWTKRHQLNLKRNI